MVGALGLLQDVGAHGTVGFKESGDLVVLLGASEVRGRASDLAGSEFIEVVHGLVAGRPAIDLGLERRVQEVCRRAVVEGVVSSATIAQMVDWPWLSPRAAWPVASVSGVPL